jgi:ADP-ribosylglycohydrolase
MTGKTHDMHPISPVWGAVIGDLSGSVYEHAPTKREDIEIPAVGAHFTDDTVLTAAVANAILHAQDYAVSLRDFGRRYPRAGYGMSFFEWLFDEARGPYQSWGNGAAMRVSPVGCAFDTVDRVLEQAERSAAVTHDHPEGVKGAQATALAVFLALQGTDKAGIKREITRRFGYDLDRSLEHIRPGYGFDVSCQGSVPESIICFLESTDLEDAVRKAISLGGDADTMACIAGSIAAAHYRVGPASLVREVRARMPRELIDVLDAFAARYPARA